MMVAIFTFMLLALATGQWASRRLAFAALIICLALATGEFLWEVYSPIDGFRLPWLQATRSAGTAA